MKLAYTHDWLYKVAGAEEVLGAMLEVQLAPVYTLFYNKKTANELKIKEIETSFLNNVPGIEKVYKNFLPLYPYAVKSWELEDYDVVVSSSHSVAKGFKKREGQLHICYCHTPMRYIWDLYNDYLRSLSPLKRVPFALTAHVLRRWDLETSKSVDKFIANSKFVAKRIKRIYGMDATVIYPPVNVESFEPEEEKSDYYIFIGRLFNAYKRVDIVVEAFNELGKKLIVVGDGDDFETLKRMAKPNIEFTGWLSHSDICQVLKSAKALILPSVDDFGIVSVEAQACGTPVLAYYRGGARETVIPDKTGLFFFEQSKEAIIKAVINFENVRRNFNTGDLINNANRFSKERFKREFKSFLNREIERKFN